MLWPMCRAQTTWKPSGWLHSGGTNEHLRWTLGPMSSGPSVGRDGSEGTASANRKLHLNQNSEQIYPTFYCKTISPLHRPLTSTSPGGHSLGPKSRETEMFRSSFSRFIFIIAAQRSEMQTFLVFLSFSLWRRRCTLTFSAVSHAALRGLQVVQQELATVPHRDGDAEEAAVLGAAVEELPGGAGGELADLSGPGQGGVLQGQPHRSLCAAAIHLHEGGQQKRSLPAARRLLHPPAGLKVLIRPGRGGTSRGDHDRTSVLPPRRRSASPPACC